MITDRHELVDSCETLRKMVLVVLQEKEVPLSKWSCEPDERLPLARRTHFGPRSCWMQRHHNQTGLEVVLLMLQGYLHAAPLLGVFRDHQEGLQGSLQSQAPDQRGIEVLDRRVDPGDINDPILAAIQDRRPAVVALRIRGVTRRIPDRRLVRRRLRSPAPLLVPAVPDVDVPIRLHADESRIPARPVAEG